MNQWQESAKSTLREERGNYRANLKNGKKHHKKNTSSGSRISSQEHKRKDSRGKKGLAVELNQMQKNQLKSNEFQLLKQKEMIRLEKLLKNSPERLYPVKKYTSLQTNGLIKPELLVAKALEKAYHKNERVLRTDQVQGGRRSNQRNSKSRQSSLKKGAKIDSHLNSSKRVKSPLIYHEASNVQSPHLISQMHEILNINPQLTEENNNAYEPINMFGINQSSNMKARQISNQNNNVGLNSSASSKIIENNQHQFASFANSSPLISQQISGTVDPKQRSNHHPNQTDVQLIYTQSSPNIVVGSSGLEEVEAAVARNQEQNIFGGKKGYKRLTDHHDQFGIVQLVQSISGAGGGFSSRKNQKQSILHQQQSDEIGKESNKPRQYIDDDEDMDDEESRDDNDEHQFSNVKNEPFEHKQILEKFEQIENRYRLVEVRHLTNISEFMSLIGQVRNVLGGNLQKQLQEEKCELQLLQESLAKKGEESTANLRSKVSLFGPDRRRVMKSMVPQVGRKHLLCSNNSKVLLTQASEFMQNQLNLGANLNQQMQIRDGKMTPSSRYHENSTEDARGVSHRVHSTHSADQLVNIRLPMVQQQQDNLLQLNNRRISPHKLQQRALNNVSQQLDETRQQQKNHGGSDSSGCNVEIEQDEALRQLNKEKSLESEQLTQNIQKVIKRVNTAAKTLARMEQKMSQFEQSKKLSAEIGGSQEMVFLRGMIGGMRQDFEQYQLRQHKVRRAWESEIRRLTRISQERAEHILQLKDELHESSMQCSEAVYSLRKNENEIHILNQTLEAYGYLQPHQISQNQHQPTAKQQSNNFPQMSHSATSLLLQQSPPPHQPNKATASSNKDSTPALLVSNSNLHEQWSSLDSLKAVLNENERLKDEMRTLIEAAVKDRQVIEFKQRDQILKVPDMVSQQCTKLMQDYSQKILKEQKESREKVSELRKDLEAQRIRAVKLIEEKAKLENEVNQVKLQKRELQEQLKHKMRKCKEVEIHLEVAKNKLGEADKRTEQKIQKCDELASQQYPLKESLSKAKEEVVTLQIAVQRAEKSQKILEKDLEESLESKRQLQGQIGRLEIERDELKQLIEMKSNFIQGISERSNMVASSGAHLDYQGQQTLLHLETIQRLSMFIIRKQKDWSSISSTDQKQLLLADLDQPAQENNAAAKIDSLDRKTIENIKELMDEHVFELLDRTEAKVLHLQKDNVQMLEELINFFQEQLTLKGQISLAYEVLAHLLRVIEDLIPQAGSLKSLVNNNGGGDRNSNSQTELNPSQFNCDLPKAVFNIFNKVFARRHDFESQSLRLEQEKGIVEQMLAKFESKLDLMQNVNGQEWQDALQNAKQSLSAEQRREQMHDQQKARLEKENHELQLLVDQLKMKHEMAHQESTVLKQTLSKQSRKFKAMQFSTGNAETQNKLMGNFMTKLAQLREKIALGASSQQIMDSIAQLIEQNEAESRKQTKKRKEFFGRELSADNNLKNYASRSAINGGGDATHISGGLSEFQGHGYSDFEQFEGTPLTKKYKATQNDEDLDMPLHNTQQTNQKRNAMSPFNSAVKSRQQKVENNLNQNAEQSYTNIVSGTNNVEERIGQNQNAIGGVITNFVDRSQEDLIAILEAQACALEQEIAKNNKSNRHFNNLAMEQSEKSMVQQPDHQLSQQKQFGGGFLSGSNTNLHKQSNERLTKGSNNRAKNKHHRRRQSNGVLTGNGSQKLKTSQDLNRANEGFRGLKYSDSVPF